MKLMEAMPVINLTEQCKDGCILGPPIIQTSGLLMICGLLVTIVIISLMVAYLLKNSDKNEEPPCPPPSQ